MAFSLSPSVDIFEKNVSFNINNLPSANTAMVLEADIGPAFQITPITTVEELETTFGYPTKYNYRDWFNAWNFLQYASSLYVTRPLDIVKGTANVGMGLSGGLGIGVTLTAGTASVLMGSSTGVTATTIAASLHYFTVNGEELSITPSLNDTYATITGLIVTALAAATGDAVGVTVAFTDTVGFVFTAGSTGTGEDVTVGPGTTGQDLWTVDTLDFSGYGTPVLAVGPESPTTITRLGKTGLYNDNAAALAFDTYAATYRLEFFNKWVTSDQNLGIAICSDTDNWALDIANDSIFTGVTFGAFFDFEPNWTNDEFAYLIYRLNSNGTYEQLEKGIVSYTEGAKDVFGKNIWAFDHFFNSSKYMYCVVGSTAANNVNTAGSALPMLQMKDPNVDSVTFATPGTGYITGERLVFTNATGCEGWGAEATIVATAGAITGVTVTNAGYGYTGVPTVTAESYAGADAVLVAVMDSSTGLYPLLSTSTDIDVYSGYAADYAAGDIEEAFDNYSDPETFDVNLLLSHEASVFYVSDIALARKDCLAIVGAYDTSGILGVSSTAATTDIISDFGYLGVTPSPIPTYTNYAAHYGNMKYQYDKYSDKNRWVPVVGDVAGLFAENDRINDPWWAVAGLNRGVMRNAIKLAFNPNKTNKDQLYINSINPVVSVLGEGAAIILGQKTATSVASAFDRINVRRLLITIEKAIATSLRPFMFEFNDEGTRTSILGLINPYMSNIQARRGVYEYQVVCDESNNTAEVIDANGLIVNIFVKPTKVAEFIQINVIVAKTGTSFDEIAAVV